VALKGGPFDGVTVPNDGDVAAPKLAFTGHLLHRHLDPGIYRKYWRVVCLYVFVKRVGDTGVYSFRGHEKGDVQ